MRQLTRQMLKNKDLPLPPDVEVNRMVAGVERVLQFGEGNFLRAFVDWMFDLLNEKTGFDGSVVVVQPIRQGLIHVLNKQDGLYTLLLRGIQDGRETVTRRVITSISRGIDPYRDWQAVLSCAASPNMRFVVSNTTEAGIAYMREPQPDEECPCSFPAKVAACLYHRYNTFGGDRDKGMVFLPCELIDRNGDRLKEFVLAHAKNWRLPGDFAGWLDECCIFCNTLVDRIVPGYPRDDAEAITAQLGYTDRLLDTGEAFHLWVIEGPDQLRHELPFQEAGLNVVWTRDVTPYRTRKVRVLNGAHTAAVLAAFHCGSDTVDEMMADDLVSAFVKQCVFREILPVVPLPQGEKEAFAHSVLERFHNIFIRHELLSISPNSVAKWKVRVLPSLKEYLAQTGRLPRCLGFSLAALLVFYDGTLKGEVMHGMRNAAVYPIRDNEEVLQVFADTWPARRHNLPALVSGLLSCRALWDEDLTAVDGLVGFVAEALCSMRSKGMRGALQELLSTCEH